TLRMRVIPVPVRSDNYSYLLVDERSGLTAAIDPFDPQKVIQRARLEEGLILTPTILATHHHHDHSGGNSAYIQALQTSGEEKSSDHRLIKVYGGSDKVLGLTDLVKDGDEIRFGEDLLIRCLKTNCHTQDSICYYVQDTRTLQKFVFTGDTLFVAGCGKFFEGTAAQMNEALNVKLASLPNETITCVGHEYTRSSVRFARMIEPENLHVKQLEQTLLNEEGLPRSDPKSFTTCRFTIGDEKKFNVFMRVNEPEVIESVLKLTSKDDEEESKRVRSDPVEVLKRLRGLKDNF
ncbi:beta-lactamase-like protein, partial [Phakopsora pachyrhizi]